jgi:hypothetical protein
MSAGQHLDPLAGLAVAGHQAMVVTVGTHQVGQHLGVGGVGLGAGAASVALAVASDGLGVDRVHLIAGRHQRGDPQPPIRFDAHHHLGRITRTTGHHRTQLGDPSDALGQTLAAKTHADGVADLDVVMLLGPIITHEDHLAVPLSVDAAQSLEVTIDALMEVLPGTPSHW